MADLEGLASKQVKSIVNQAFHGALQLDREVVGTRFCQEYVKHLTYNPLPTSGRSIIQKFADGILGTFNSPLFIISVYPNFLDTTADQLPEGKTVTPLGFTDLEVSIGAGGMKEETIRFAELYSQATGKSVRVWGTTGGISFVVYPQLPPV